MVRQLPWLSPVDSSVSVLAAGVRAGGKMTQPPLAMESRMAGCHGGGQDPRARRERGRTAYQMVLRTDDGDDVDQRIPHPLASHSRSPWSPGQCKEQGGCLQTSHRRPSSSANHLPAVVNHRIQVQN